MAEKKKSPPVKYIAQVGLTLKTGDRVEAGERYPGKPPAWLVDQGKVVKDEG